MPCKHRRATAAHYYTTGQDLTWPLFLYARYTSNAYFLSDYPYHLAQEGCDGRTDRQKSPNDCSNPSTYALWQGSKIKFFAKLNGNMQGAKLSMYNSMELYRWVLTSKSFAILLANSPWPKPPTKVLFRHGTVINQLFHRTCSQIMLWMEGSVVLHCKMLTILIKSAYWKCIYQSLVWGHSDNVM